MTIVLWPSRSGSPAASVSNTRTLTYALGVSSQHRREVPLLGPAAQDGGSGVAQVCAMVSDAMSGTGRCTRCATGIVCDG
jgi:hypothetical protein